MAGKLTCSHCPDSVVHISTPNSGLDHLLSWLGIWPHVCPDCRRTKYVLVEYYRLGLAGAGLAVLVLIGWLFWPSGTTPELSAGPAAPSSSVSVTTANPIVVVAPSTTAPRPATTTAPSTSPSTSPATTSSTAAVTTTSSTAAPVATTAAPAPAKAKPTGRWTIQVGAFKSAANADKLAARLRAKGLTVEVVPVVSGGKTLHRVRVGDFATAKGAKKTVAELKKLKLPTFVTRRD